MSKKDKMLEFKNRDNYLRHLTELFNINCTQFVYEGLPDTIPYEFIEFYYAINGHFVVGKVKELSNNDIYIATGSYNGDYNGYLPDSYTAAVLGLGEISGKWYGENKDVCICKNNILGSPEFDIPFTAGVLTEVDISERCNVIFARLNRIPYADNDKQKAAIESAIQSIIKGDPFAVQSRDIKNQFEEFLEGAKQDPDKFLDLVDPDKINGLQYLNQYSDNVMKRFLMRRGYMMHTTSKLAQQTNTELHGADSYSLLYPLEQLKQRQEDWDKVNAMYGTNITVDFNPVLKKVYKDYFAEPEEQTKEGKKDPEETEDTKTEESEDTTGEESGDNDTDS